MSSNNYDDFKFSQNEAIEDPSYDPHKTGLGGSGRKWYYRFLAQGLEPEEARNRVLERKEMMKTAADDPVAAAEMLKFKNHMNWTLLEKANFETFCNRMDIKGSYKNWFIHYIREGFQPDIAMKTAERRQFEYIKSADTPMEEKIDQYCRRHQIKGPRKNLFSHFLKHGMNMEAARKKMKRVAPMKLMRTFNNEAFNTQASTSSSFSRGTATNIDVARRKLKHIAHSKTGADRSTHNSDVCSADASQPTPSPSSAGIISDQRNDISSMQTVLKMAIVARTYPHYTLSWEEMSGIEDALIEEVGRGWEVCLNFEGIVFGDGILRVGCANFETAQWLIYVTPRLFSWRGVEIRACQEDDLPQPLSKKLRSKGYSRESRHF